MKVSLQTTVPDGYSTRQYAELQSSAADVVGQVLRRAAELQPQDDQPQDRHPNLKGLVEVGDASMEYAAGTTLPTPNPKWNPAPADYAGLKNFHFQDPHTKETVDFHQEGNHDVFTHVRQIDDNVNSTKLTQRLTMDRSTGQATFDSHLNSPSYYGVQGSYGLSTTETLGLLEDHRKSDRNTAIATSTIALGFAAACIYGTLTGNPLLGIGSIFGAAPFGAICKDTLDDYMSTKQLSATLRAQP
ncbi:MAG: hypothetical protein ACYCW6_18260 [Candidatus Xenobia bacterium]